MMETDLLFSLFILRDTNHEDAVEIGILPSRHFGGIASQSGEKKLSQLLSPMVFPRDDMRAAPCGEYMCGQWFYIGHFPLEIDRQRGSNRKRLNGRQRSDIGVGNAMIFFQFCR